VDSGVINGLERVQSTLLGQIVKNWTGCRKSRLSDAVNLGSESCREAVSTKTMSSSRRRLLETKNCRQVPPQLGWVATTTGDFVLPISVLLASVEFVFTLNLVDPHASISCRMCVKVAALKRPGAPFSNGTVSVEQWRRRLMTSAYGSAGRVFVEQHRQRVVVCVLEPVNKHVVRVDERHTQLTRKQVGTELVGVEVAPRPSAEVNEL